jgi:hypothetical protein
MAIDLGYGKHVWQIPFRNLNDMYLIGQITNTFAICAAAWSKTSFGIALLMISDGIHGKTRIFIWFALVSMNLLLGITAMLFWVGCTPLEKAWHPFIRGTCWSPNVLITYNIFTSGASNTQTCSQNTMLTKIFQRILGPWTWSWPSFPGGSSWVFAWTPRRKLGWRWP